MIADQTCFKLHSEVYICHWLLYKKREVTKNNRYIENNKLLIRPKNPEIEKKREAETYITTTLFDPAC